MHAGRRVGVHPRAERVRGREVEADEDGPDEEGPELGGWERQCTTVMYWSDGSTETVEARWDTHDGNVTSGGLVLLDSASASACDSGNQ